ncbi:hypothetical protein TCAL_12092 [Tigriopus californicus]|uniref:Glycoside hydrolase family 5 domain-containing protein n=1 Tax=Tigriopus californicus TaxID=6832 RepID=A0A553NPM2_TIGCA|nr:endoglycoceramidase-like [Tigriopus californicus]TRY67375.1 hypothetical protein TCAL_12092 [Tigriopus californicus]|eukprot:TCALIF_12092-PA protein Name:"Similar to Endoglycoceramidase (Cyanea nozakii)" AED:0.06 eAED:0.12 QI:0/-1/0/1/-1/1/1/0/577
MVPTLLSVVIVGLGFQISGAERLSKIHVSPTTGFFEDELGRTRLFRGINSVVKKHPWYDPQMLDPKRVQELSDLGFNVIRLGTMWTGVMPESSKLVNQTYVKALKTMAHGFAQSGMYTLLDMHQDLLWKVQARDDVGTYWGVPPWLKHLVQPHEKLFPWPLEQIGAWPCGYLTQEISRGFQSIYDNKNGTARWLSVFWKHMASIFKADSHILGYELINEPWAGDIFSDPSLLLPGVAGRKNLEPLYQQLHTVIREQDDETLIFWEPVTWAYTFPGSSHGLKDVILEAFFKNIKSYELSMLIQAFCGTKSDTNNSELSNFIQNLMHSVTRNVTYQFSKGLGAKPSVFGTGFQTVPGGPDYRNRTVMSWHYYCWAWGFNGGNAEPFDPLIRDLCDNFLGPLEFQTVQDRTEEVGGSGRMLTEFGLCTPDITQQHSKGFIECNFVIESADKQFESWIYWDTAPGNQVLWDEKGHLIPDRAAVFSRPYPRAIDGIPTLLRFDINTKVFRFEFWSELRFGVYTEVFIPPLHYPNGNYRVDLSPQLIWLKDSKNVNVIKMSRNPTIPQAKSPQSYFVEITPFV